jgi:two-component system, NarL family, nitrate/nitrite response regulator NarL
MPQNKTVADQKPKIRIILVDDHPFVREGIRACLASRPDLEVVGEVANGAEALEQAKALEPDVIIMDISMPQMNGLEATRQLRQQLPHIRILVLTMHEKREFTTQIIQSGACGYVSKNSSPAELIRAIETVYRGETYFSSLMAGAFIRSYVENAGKLDNLKSNELSLRENEVLTLIAEGYCNKEVGNVLGISVRTVEKHRERIMDKLNLHSVVELTKYAISKHMVEVE